MDEQPQPPPQFAAYPRPGEQPPRMPSGPPDVDFSLINLGWQTVQRNFGIWIPALLMLGVISYGLSMPFSIYFQATHPFKPGEFPDIGSLLFQQLVMLPVGFVNGALATGLYNIGLGLADGRTPAIMDVFNFRGRFVMVLATIVLLNLILIPAWLLIVPGLLLSPLLVFAPVLVLERNMGPFEAMRVSFDTLKAHMFPMLGFVIVAGLASLVGAFLCCIGLLFTVPIGHMALAYQYRRFFPPIADAQPIVDFRV